MDDLTTTMDFVLCHEHDEWLNTTDAGPRNVWICDNGLRRVWKGLPADVGEIRVQLYKTKPHDEAVFIPWQAARREVESWGGVASFQIGGEFPSWQARRLLSAARTAGYKYIEVTYE